MKIPSVRSLKKSVVLASLIASLLPAPTQADEFRAIWVDAFGNGFLNASQVTQLVNDCRTYNFNAVVVQVRRRGDAFYIPQAPNGDPRTTAVASGFDALQEIINQCHGGTPRIEVHAWVAANLVWGTGGVAPTQPGHVYNLHPEYLMKDSAGGTLLEDGYWVDPGNPDAMTWNYNMAKDIVSRYDIDGFHWDRIRYPSETSGYNEVAISRYNAEFGLTGQPGATSAQFKTWRRRQVTDFIRWTSADLWEIKPSLMISASVFANRSDATSFRFQDWAAWANEGIIDFLLPMNYVSETSNPGLFATRVNDIFNNQGVRRSYIGVGAYLNTKENTVFQMDLVRSKPMLGNALYSYRTSNSGTVDQDATFQYIKDNFQPTYEPTPTLPWLAAPTKAIIKGTVTRQDNGDVIYNATMGLTTTPARTQRTESHGTYGFFEVDPGTYTLTASSAGISTVVSNVTVAAGGIYNVDVVLNLPPTGDTIPPIITFVTSSGVSSNSATITWTTDEASDSRVDYGTTTAYGSTATNASMVTSHSVTLAGLSANTTYHYRVRSRDAAGNEGVSGNFQFTTAAAVAEIIVDNPSATVVGSWSSGTAADRFGTNYFFRTFGTNANHVTFRPTVVVGGFYQVYEWHSAGANRATNTPVIVTSASGVTTNRVNQQVNGGRWNFLGTFSFNAGTSGTIRVSDGATGPAGAQIMADAFRLVYLPDTISDPIIIDNIDATVTGAWTTNTSAGDKFGANYLNRTFGTNVNNVLYTPSFVVPGTYQVYEWHTQGSNRATNTPHVVTFNGGVTTNRVNQQVNGGQWNLIGAFRFNTGTSGSVRIRDGATGPAGAQVIADAIRFVFLPPPVPGEVTAEAISSSQIEITWQDNSTDEANFIVARSTVSGGPYTPIATLGANATSFTDSGLATETTYYYAVKATTGPGGASAYSNEASATTLPFAPQAPTVLAAMATGSSTVNLTWTDNNDALEISYIVARSTSASGPFVDIATVESRVQTFGDTGLNPETTYYYVVRAHNGGGDSPNSNIASATTFSDVPPAPTGLTATAVSPTQVDLNWIDNANNETAIAVIRSPLNGSYSTIATLPPNTTSYSDTTAAPHTTYYYYLHVSNGSGSSDSAVVEVTTLNSIPVADAGDDQSVSAGENCQAEVTLDGTGSFDADNDALAYTWSGSFGSVNGVTPTVSLGLGTHTVFLMVSDGFGGYATNSVIITVSDTTAPTLTLNGAADVTVECHDSYTDAGATASDNCSGDLTESIIISGVIDPNTPGVYTVTYTVTDLNGNTTTATRTVSVVDTSAPALALNGAETLTVECHTTFSDPGASATDACAGDLTASIVVSGSVDANTPGSYTLTYTVIDPSGNVSTVSRTVNVVDTTAPTVTLNGSTALTLECHSSFTDDGATASDTCAGDLSANIVVTGAVDANTPGVYTLTYTVSDASGNSASAVRTVTVVDTTAPTLTLNGAASMTLTSHEPFVDPGASASDICTGDLTSLIAVFGSVNPDVVGTYTLTYSITDASGNTSTAIRTVNVIDTSAPVITLNGAASMTVECHSVFADPGATAQDDYAGDLTIWISVSGFVDANVPGTYLLTYTVSDLAGNTATAIRTVTVSDTLAPALTLNGSASVTVEAYSGYSDAGATASDACAGDLTAAITVSGSVNANVPGVYTLTYSVNDGNGHTSTATRTVTVVDTTAPTIATPANITVVASTPSGTNVTFTATATDLVSGSVPVTATPASGSLFPIGVTTVTLTAQDAKGNTATSTFTVTVTEAPPISVVRHAPSLNGNGQLRGSIQQLLGEDVTVNGGFYMTGDLLVPGTPTLKLNGSVNFSGVIAGSGSASPTGYKVTINGNSTVRYLRTKTDATTLPSVPQPPTPTGTRTVTINSAGQSIGDPATLKDLTLNGGVGDIAVPPGTYGNFIVNGYSSLVLGVAGSSTPTVYNLQNLILNGGSKLIVVGPVALNVANGFNANGQVGMTNQPSWLQISIANGGLTVNGGSTVSAFVNAPSGMITVNGNSALIGGTKSDRLTVNGNSVIKAQ